MFHQLLPIASLRRQVSLPLLVMLALLLVGCSISNEDPVEIVFAFGPDDGVGTIQPLIDQFNEANKGQIHVSWKQGSRFSDAFYHELKAEFESGEPQFDVVGTDVIWTPTFASKEWVEDLTQRFFDNHNPSDYLETAMESVSYQFKVWGMPWFTDASMLYYRKDLLRKSGFAYPPATWDEVIAMSRKIQEDGGAEHGYVFQGAKYEGGVTNLCEFIWNAEGDILLGDLYVAATFDVDPIDSEVVVIDSDASRRGLEDLDKLVKSGVVPTDINTLREKEAAAYFSQGKAAFMRSWASSFGYIVGEDSRVSSDQIGLTALPTSGRRMTPYSCLGGWNLMISVFSSPEKKEAAWKFIDFMTNEQSQKYRAVKGGYLPSLRSLYQDHNFLRKAPVADFARQVIPVCKERPRSPYYMEMSPVISHAFSRLLAGQWNPAEAVEDLDIKLSEIIDRHQSEVATN